MLMGLAQWEEMGMGLDVNLPTGLRALSSYKCN